MSSMAIPARSTETEGRFHWTVDTFYRAINAGVFDEPERLELINGEIRQRMSMNPAHAALTERIARRFRALFEPRFWVREEKPLRISFDGEPEPDILVVTGSADDYEERHPTPEVVRLLVEVADSSADYDTGEKAALYAQAGIPDYWVTLVNQRVLVIHRDPTPDGYASTIRLREGDVVTPLFAPDVTIAVADLLPRISMASSE